MINFTPSTRSLVQEVACGAATHSVALSRFLKATSDAVKQGPMGKVKVPAQRGAAQLRSKGQSWVAAQHSQFV